MPQGNNSTLIKRLALPNSRQRLTKAAFGAAAENSSFIRGAVIDLLCRNNRSRPLAVTLRRSQLLRLQPAKLTFAASEFPSIPPNLNLTD